HIAALEVRVAELVVGLDDDQFAVREKATRELKGLGPEAAFALQRAREDSSSAEVRRRLQTVLARMKPDEEKALDAEPRSVLLMLTILEEIGTSQAHEVLRELAAGPAKATVTREARAALQRLSKKPSRRSP